jgi:hypothetical protein
VLCCAVLQPGVRFASVRETLHRQWRTMVIPVSRSGSEDAHRAPAVTVSNHGNPSPYSGHWESQGTNIPTWLMVNNPWLTSRARLQTCSEVPNALRPPQTTNDRRASVIVILSGSRPSGICHMRACIPKHRHACNRSMVVGAASHTGHLGRNGRCSRHVVQHSLVAAHMVADLYASHSYHSSPPSTFVFG